MSFSVSVRVLRKVEGRVFCGLELKNIIIKLYFVIGFIGEVYWGFI